MKNILKFLGAIALTFTSNAQDWSGIPIPADAGSGMAWELSPNASDDFNYTFNETNQRSNFGENKWYNFYHNAWDGPGTTYWKYNHVSVDGDDLVLRASRWDRSNEELPFSQFANKMGRPKDGVNAGCITSNTRVLYPVYVEARVSVADIVLASDIWLLSPDDTQEIDIIECYGGNEQGNAFFSEFIHLSHHSFIRQPFTDYQPRDFNSWWGTPEVENWGEHHWNNGNRRYVRIGVNWISPFHFEYYIDGKVVRVLYDKAVATNRNGTWTYTYPTMTNGKLDTAASGFQKMTEFATSNSYSLATLQAASNTSSVSIIDPYNFQGGNGFTKELDIIINVESQDWHVDAGRTPTDAQLQDPARNTMKVDWIRTYKPIPSSVTTAVTGINITANSLTLEENTTGTLKANVLPSNATDQEISWSSSNNTIVTVDNNGTVTAIATGSAIITATSNDGSFTDSLTVTVNSEPDMPDPSGDTIVIEAENFNTTSGTFNDGSAGGPGLGVNNAGTIINYVNSNDFVEYSVNIGSAGEYEVSYQISSPSNNAEIQLAVDGTTVSTTPVPNNGSWDSYATLNTIGNITLNAGIKTFRVTASGTNQWQWNLDKIILTKVLITAPINEVVNPTSITIEAEDFTSTNGTFNDSFAGGPGLGVNPTATNINYVNNGDFTEYAINVPTGGTFNIDYLITTTSDEAKIQLLVDGVVVDNTNIPNNGSWDNYETVNGGSATISSGPHTIRVNATGSNVWQWNLDRITLSPSSSSKSIVGIASKAAISIHPNPTINTAYVNGVSGTVVYQLYTIEGSSISSGTISDANNELDVSQLSSGIYFLNIETDNGKETIKMLKL